jgi:hypothetical protein
MQVKLLIIEYIDYNSELLYNNDILLLSRLLTMIVHVLMIL